MEKCFAKPDAGQTRRWEDKLTDQLEPANERIEALGQVEGLSPGVWRPWHSHRVAQRELCQCLYVAHAVSLYSASSLPSCHMPGASHPAPALPFCPLCAAGARAGVAALYGASGQIGHEFSIMVTPKGGGDCRGARLAGPGLVFVNAVKEELDAFVEVVQPFIKHPYVLMTGGSDHTLAYQSDKRYSPYDAGHVARIKAITDDPRLVAWFAENLDEVWSPKVRPSPLGFNARSHEELWAARAWRGSRSR